MMGEEYVPDTNEVREAYIWQDYEACYYGPYSRDGEEFDRWLAKVKAEVWDEGETDGRINSTEHRPSRKMTNPYRAND